MTLDIQTKALDKLKSATPGTSTLFHYTTQQGLLGIIQDKALWLSSIRHLSDAAEFGYAVEMVRTRLTHKLSTERGPWNSYYGAILERLGTIQDQLLFVGSFSEQADLLSQWRAYAPTGGFSIGFEYEHLKAMAEKQDLTVMKCIYDHDEHQAILEDIINIGGTLVEKGGEHQAATAFLIGLLKFAPALKDPSFFEEREWRVVSGIKGPEAAKLKFRAGKSMLIPYQEFKLAENNRPMPIKRVIVGPTPHMNLSISSLVNLFLSSGNVDRQTFSIAPSRTPYRTW
jgi:hypothetical protein